MTRGRPLATILAVVALLLMLGALAIRFWASQQAFAHVGPTHIEASEDRVVALADGRLFVLDDSGEIISVNTLDDVGLRDAPIDLEFLDNGLLVIAEQRPARLQQCQLDGWRCQLLPLQSAHAPARQYKVLADEEKPHEGFWISDAQGDSLLWYDPQTGALEHRVDPGLLAGPNSVVHGGGGALWVADTDNRRLLELVPGGSVGWRVAGREHTTLNEHTVEQRHFPILMERSPDRRLWVTLSSEFSDPAADLAVYDLEQGARFRVPLPGSRFATDLAFLGNDVLVTDMDAMRIYRVDSRTLEVSDFGSPEFRSTMDSVSRARKAMHRVSQVALAGVVGFAVLMIAFAARATPATKRWTPAPELFDSRDVPEDVVAPNGIHWMQRRPRADRLIRWAGWIGFAALLVTGIAILATAGWLLWQGEAASRAELRDTVVKLSLLLVLLALAMIAQLPLFRAVWHSLQRRIGTDGRKLYLRLEDGRSLVVPPEDLAYTPRTLLYRGYSVPLKDGRQQSLYKEGEIRAYLAPLLLRSARLSPRQGLAWQWRNRDKVLIGSAISAGVVLTLALFLVFYS